MEIPATDVPDEIMNVSLALAGNWLFLRGRRRLYCSSETRDCFDSMV